MTITFRRDSESGVSVLNVAYYERLPSARTSVASELTDPLGSDPGQTPGLTPASAWSRIPSAVSACCLVSTSGGDRRIAFCPAPRTSRPRVKHSRTTRVALGGRALLRLAIAHELDADHQPAAAHVADDADACPSAPCAPASRCAPTSAAFFISAVAQQLDRGERRRARHGIAAERAGVRARAATTSRPTRAVATPSGSPDAMPFAIVDDVRLRRRSARSRTSSRCGPCPTALRRRSSSMPCCVVSSRSRWWNDVRRHDVAALALDRLDDDRRDFVGRHEVHEQLLLDEAQALGRARLRRQRRPGQR